MAYKIKINAQKAVPFVSITTKVFAHQGGIRYESQTFCEENLRKVQNH